MHRLLIERKALSTRAHFAQFEHALQSGRLCHIPKNMAPEKPENHREINTEKCFKFKKILKNSKPCACAEFPHLSL
jgi:hypothetical protein